MSRLNSKLALRGIFSLILLTGLLICSQANAHPFHTSHAELEWNPKSSRIEVALQVWPEDLRAMCQSQFKLKNLSVAKAKLNNAFRAYLTDKFVLYDAANKKQTLHFLGFEHDDRNYWLYFELEANGLGRDWQLEVKLFHELNKNQINTVTIHNRKSVNPSRRKLQKSMRLTLQKPKLIWPFRQQSRRARLY